MLAAPRTFRLKIGRVKRYAFPALVGALLLAGAGEFSSDLDRTGSPFVYVPYLLVGLFLVWLFLTMPRYGDLTVSGTRISLRLPLAFTETVDRGSIAAIVVATILYPSRYSPTPRMRYLLVGSDNHCYLLLRREYDLAALADALGVPVKRLSHPLKYTDANRRYPGSTHLVLRRVGAIVLALGFVAVYTVWALRHKH